MLLRNSVFIPYFLKNYIRSDEASATSLGWSLYADSASSTPTDGTGGISTLVFNTNKINPLNSPCDFILTKTGNLQGQGISYDFTIDKGDINKIFEINFNYDTTDSNYVSQDLRIYIFDITNNVLIQPTEFNLLKTQGFFKAIFSTTSSQSYRLILHVSTTTSATWSVYLNNFYCGVQQYSTQPAINDWQAYTPTFSGLGTVTNINCASRRVGDTLEIQGIFTVGTGTAARADISLPNNLVIGTTGLRSGTNLVGSFVLSNNTTSYNYAVLATPSRSTLQLGFNSASPTNSLAEANGNSFSAGTYSFFAKVPISGWSSNVISAQSRVFKISSFLASGLRVTGTAPANLGEYRTYLRNASARTYTETNGAPATSPSSVNGMTLYAPTPWATANSSNNPTKWEIFVGKNKYVQLQTCSSSGFTGPLDITIINFGGGVNPIGYSSSYDPTSGIFTLTGVSGAALTSTGFVGLDGDGNASSSGFFDIVVSDNPLPVQIDTIVDQEVFVQEGNGHGSTNTRIRRFSTVVRNVGSAITYIDSATNGSSFIINQTGMYSMTYADYNSTGLVIIGISLNSTQLSTNIESINNINRLTGTANSSPTTGGGVSHTVIKRLVPGDVIRPHTNGVPTNPGVTTAFSITKLNLA